MKELKKLFTLLTPHERRMLYLLFIAIVVMAGLQVVSVASIMPFLSVASNPSSIHENQYLEWAYSFFGFEQNNSFLIVLGLCALSALVISNVFIIITTWAQQKYIWNRNHSLSRRLIKSYMGQPYEFFLTKNSSQLGKNIIEEVREVTVSMMKPVLKGIAKSIVAIAIIAFLFTVNPVVATIVALTLGFAYVIVYYIVRDRIERIGAERVEAQSDRFQFISEAFSGIKEVKVRGKERAFLKQYNTPSQKYADRRAQYTVLQRAPRYILEAVAFGGIILIAIYLITVQEDIRKVIPMLGLYAFAGYRLMPALQKAFKGIASIRFNTAALNAVKDGLNSYKEGVKTVRDIEAHTECGVMNLNDRIELDDVSFRYPGAEESAIDGVSFEVPAHSSVGFVGKTGSGKTTLVDIVLGLLKPQEGSLYVDEKQVGDNNIRAWQNNIGYVPQQIYMTDNSILANIAFGVPEEDISMEAVIDSARRANIYDFVTNELPNRWNTNVGERGVKLSGGQRQRIGIARALYHKPSVLIFDEATSALDRKTENKVMNEIYKLDGQHTILMIAHRLSTVKKADKIIVLTNGRKVGEGSYPELSRRNKYFKSIT